MSDCRGFERNGDAFSAFLRFQRPKLKFIPSPNSKAVREHDLDLRILLKLWYLFASSIETETNLVLLDSVLRDPG
jgi:hypothetical protein